MPNARMNMKTRKLPVPGRRSRRRGRSRPRRPPRATAYGARAGAARASRRDRGAAACRRARGSAARARARGTVPAAATGRSARRPAPQRTPAPAAQASSLQSSRTWRMKRRTALLVPARPASLPVPSSVGCGVAGNAANSAGSWIRPPPPAMASMRPAPKAAARTSAISGFSGGLPEPGAWGEAQRHGGTGVEPVLDEPERHGLGSEAAAGGPPRRPRA